MKVVIEIKKSGLDHEFKFRVIGEVSWESAGVIFTINRLAETVEIAQEIAKNILQYVSDTDRIWG